MQSPIVLRQTVLLGDGLTGVNRVISLLRQRRYDVRSVAAEVARPDGHEVTWLTFVISACTEADAALLAERLLRLPTVLCVSEIQ
ncbi:MAG TPA: hypothetical protein VKB75_12520 [Jatrophihabitans sp.]|nr:hypothetical protein [Jatrophihabitans sp.]